MKFQLFLLACLAMATKGSAALSLQPVSSHFISPKEAPSFDSIPQPTRKENYLFVSGCMGGGDYPFGGLGLMLSHKTNQEGTAYFGIGASYIGNTIGGENHLTREEYVQIFPIMLDYRWEFSRSANGKFSTLLFLDGGYVVSITGNGTDASGEYEYKNGWAINPGISFKYNLFHHAGLMLDIGWMRHNSRLKWLPPSDKTGRKKWDVGLVRLSLFF